MGSVLEDEDREGGGRGRPRKGMNIPPLVQCDSIHLSWTGRAPYHVTVHDVDEPTGPPYKDFGEMSAPGIDWFVEIPAGRQVVFVLEDASGEWTSDPETIQPGPNCPSSSDTLPQVFSSATTPSTSYALFTSASRISTPLPSSLSTTSSSTTTTSSTSSTSSASSTSTSSLASSTEPNSTQQPVQSVQIVTLTRSATGSFSEYQESGSAASTQDLSAATEAAGVAKEGGGSKVGVALGVTLGLGIPILLICLAYFFHRRKSQQEMEEPYASFSDIHSRPASVHTTRSFYSLGIGKDEYDRSSLDNVPPVPPIPAAFGLTLTSPPPAKREVERGRSILPYERSGGKFMGRLSLWEGGRYRLEDVADPDANSSRPPLMSGDGSVYSGMAMSEPRDSMGTLDGQRWIDEYAQRRETFRSGTSVLNRPLTHRVV